VIAGTFAFTVHANGSTAAPLAVRRGTFRVPYTTSVPPEVDPAPALQTSRADSDRRDRPAFPVVYR
jgi:hypothetical protein